MYSKIRFPPSTCNIWIKKSWLTPKNSTLQLYKLLTPTLVYEDTGLHKRPSRRNVKQKYFCWHFQRILTDFHYHSIAHIQLHCVYDIVFCNIIFQKEYNCSLHKAVGYNAVTIPETTMQPFHFICNFIIRKVPRLKWYLLKKRLASV